MGKAFCSVEIGIIGTFPTSLATNLLVPSPPRTKTQAQSSLLISLDA